MQKKVFLMEMRNPKDAVLVFMKDKAMKLIAPKSLTVNMETSEFHSAGALKMEGFTGAPQSNRGPGPQPGSVPKIAPPPPSVPPTKKGGGSLLGPKSAPHPASPPKSDEKPAPKGDASTSPPPKTDSTVAPATPK